MTEPKKPGRPKGKLYPHRKAIRLDDELIAIAQEAGDGDMSAGIRRALREWKERRGE